MDWQPLPKPAEAAETRLISAILDGRFPIHSTLPGERELASALGVTRPTLREALQRLARDGWLEIRQGKPTRVRDYWQEGNLAVLGAAARRLDPLPVDFVSNLLEVRRLLAPEYTRLAFQRAPDEVGAFLASYPELPDTPPAFAEADFNLHHFLTVSCGNPVFTLILNGFGELYREMACVYFTNPGARRHSRSFYSRLLEALQENRPEAAEAVTRQVMDDSLRWWAAAASGEQPE
jgi:GntR family negative regulator for fad regulon and positive regulator of fabA